MPRWIGCWRTEVGGWWPRLSNAAFRWTRCGLAFIAMNVLGRRASWNEVQSSSLSSETGSKTLPDSFHQSVSGDVALTIAKEVAASVRDSRSFVDNKARGVLRSASIVLSLFVYVFSTQGDSIRGVVLGLFLFALCSLAVALFLALDHLSEADWDETDYTVAVREKVDAEDQLRTFANEIIRGVRRNDKVLDFKVAEISASRRAFMLAILATLLGAICVRADVVPNAQQTDAPESAPRSMFDASIESVRDSSFPDSSESATTDVRLDADREIVGERSPDAAD